MSHPETVWLLRDALSRVSRALEALGDGDSLFAEQTLEDLERDLAGEVSRRELTPREVSR
jgi:hypothetical protein